MGYSWVCHYCFIFADTCGCSYQYEHFDRMNGVPFLDGGPDVRKGWSLVFSFCKFKERGLTYRSNGELTSILLQSEIVLVRLN